MIAMHTRPSMAVGRCVKPMFSPIQSTFSMNSRGAADSALIPRMSAACVAMIETAMPVVKPLVTGQGIYLMRVPIRVSPISMRMIPAMMVAIIRPLYPCFSTISSTIGMKAAVGPPIWTRLPPSAAIRKPANIAVKIPSAGAGNGVAVPAGMLAIPSARASGRAISPTVTPAIRSEDRSDRVYFREKTSNSRGLKEGNGKFLFGICSFNKNHR
ncbi:MAG: hypothetical protein BWY82_00205 [Verrucomicrobia bacterium ADurb.Bin474]|nr:MAG: hypothetical protein BWY82_00205 [Verrucomicrobia bacterium ADurb.Bin474]